MDRVTVPRSSRSVLDNVLRIALGVELFGPLRRIQRERLFDPNFEGGLQLPGQEREGVVITALGHYLPAQREIPMSALFDEIRFSHLTFPRCNRISRTNQVHTTNSPSVLATIMRSFGPCSSQGS